MIIGCVTEPQYYQHDTKSFRINDQTPGNISNAISAVKSDIPSHYTGYYLLHDPIEALVARASLMSEAEHTIDIQYYIYKNDFTGSLLFEEAKKAADRGVRVRILLDDFGSFGIDDALIGLDQHPNIEVRLFNAFQRDRSLIGQLIFGFGSTTRRMHNKALIVDNQLSIIGGRNIGDEYFGANPDIVFEDLDVLLTNPATDEVSRSFDEFWNNVRSKPAHRLIRQSPVDHELIVKSRSFRHGFQIPNGKEYVKAVSQRLHLMQDRAGDIPFFWTESEVKFDSPTKVKKPRDRYDLMWSTSLQPVIDQLQKSLVIVTPYFVPGDAGVEFFRKLRAKGIEVTIITNSLESTDVPIVHSGYAPYRNELLDMGVVLYEVDGREKQKLEKDSLRSWFASRSSLHAKLFVFDDQTAFIGSPNFDPRSFYENTEIGVSLHSNDLAQVLDNALSDLVSEDAFRVMKVDNSLVWIKGDEVFHHEPGASWFKRTSNYLMRFLPVESQL